MGSSELGRWAWLIALWVALLGAILSVFGMDFLAGDAVAAIVGILAFLGGLLHLADGDRTAFFITTLVLVGLAAIEATTGNWFGVTILTDLVSNILAAAAGVAVAASVGIVFKAVYEWAMP